MRATSQRWLQRELQWRLALPVLGIVLVGGLFSAYGAQYLMNKVFDRWLLDAARSLAAEVRVVDGAPRIQLGEDAERMLVFDDVDRVNFAVMDGARLIIGQRGIPQDGQAQQRYGDGTLAFDANYLGQPVRVVWVELNKPGARTVRVGVAETLTKRQRAGRNLLLVFSPLSLLLVLAAFMVARGVRRTVSPLETLAARWNQRSHNSLQDIPTDEVPHELMPFATALNELLGRVRHVLEREQRFASTAAHQLRTPLTALQLGLSRAVEAPDLASAHRVLHELSDTTQRTARLVQQLLALSRLDPELSHTAAFSDVNLNTLSRTVGEAYLDAAADHGVKLELHEEAGPHAIVRGQAELISEALGNLVDNALRQSPAGAAVRIVVSSEPPVIAVHDSGPGVPPAEHSRIFERFARGSTAKGMGSGLGLAIVKEIADLHGASVQLDRSADGGARFAIHFEAP